MNLLYQNNIASAKRLLSLCREKGVTLATAESCTGGMIGTTLTSIPGASDVFLGGIISYANSAKETLLGVPKETLASHGAVSKESAEAMAQGAQKALGATLAVSVTGIAGPGGGTAEKPVGTVYIGISFKDITQSFLLQIDPTLSREEIRNEATRQLLTLTVKKILENY